MTTPRELADSISTSEWTIEYRPEVRKWELMQGTAHRGLYSTSAEADAARAEEEVKT